jgi:hypothetical protein
MDPQLDCPMNEIIRHVQIGLLCVQEDPVARPRMSEVVVMLSSVTVSLETPSKPALYLGGGNSYSGVSIDKLLPMSNNEVSISELELR